MTEKARLKEIVHAGPIICPRLNTASIQHQLQALIKVFKDGTTEVLCTMKEEKDGMIRCKANSKPCDFEKK